MTDFFKIFIGYIKEHPLRDDIVAIVFVAIIFVILIYFLFKELVKLKRDPVIVELVSNKLENIVKAIQHFEDFQNTDNINKTKISTEISKDVQSILKELREVKEYLTTHRLDISNFKNEIIQKIEKVEYHIESLKSSKEVVDDIKQLK